MRLCTKRGFTLLELIVGLALSGLLIGALVRLYGSFVQEISPKAIVYDGIVYEVAPSFPVSIQAFDFHQELINYLRSSELCLCFGRTQNNDYKSHRFLPLNNDFKYEQLLNLESLVQGKILSTRNLVEHLDDSIESFFEKNALAADLTCLVLGRDLNSSIFIQLRCQMFKMQATQYYLYSVMMYAMENARQLKSYRYAIKSTEDTYAACDGLKRIFYADQKEERESFDIVVFPDPCLLSNNDESTLNSLSRFTYILDGF